MSPESDTRDRVAKREEYERAGIPEYWIVDSVRREATFLQLGEDGTYHAVAADDEGRYHSRALPGFRLRADDLWMHPLPTLRSLRAELGIL